VHLSDKAVEPPGQARADLDIFIDFARRMDLRDRAGEPLIKWSDAESAFDAWRECTRGRPCDYSGMSYEKLRGSGGIQWPCNEEHPEGKQAMYDDHVFVTDPDRCESFGHDLETGTPVTPEQYRALDPGGRAFLKATPFLAPPEVPGEGYPMRLTTGRTLYQFHTRTKTARAPQLEHAAPEPWVELHPADAERLEITERDLVRVQSRRGHVEVAARISGIREGVVFVPFHYGYFDQVPADRPDGHARAANELTINDWDPVSKQPMFKMAAVRVSKAAAGSSAAPAPTTTASAPVAGTEPAPPATAGGAAAQASSSLREEAG
jgi:predicted molibdopterin-dependent oxidoreductase YjgC